mmetsp:Transcript_74705/g.200093  ORF Transcript_74705/g.200093 Transcript_74705/m.200093 type:complete len:238 (-) Transcript_74705:8-721(-)
MRIQDLGREPSMSAVPSELQRADADREQGWRPGEGGGGALPPVPTQPLHGVYHQAAGRRRHSPRPGRPGHVVAPPRRGIIIIIDNNNNNNSSSSSTNNNGSRGGCRFRFRGTSVHAAAAARAWDPGRPRVGGGGGGVGGVGSTSSGRRGSLTMRLDPSAGEQRLRRIFRTSGGGRARQIACGELLLHLHENPQALRDLESYCDKAMIKHALRKMDRQPDVLADEEEFLALFGFVNYN